ncbi:AAA family ATPase [Amycolatopsis sp. NPDC059021]|uniref:AAA family ATPase n=1 Tax=Amycolatopsis sp. NPDC059021 TaxID=3346704 RepID=UPI00366B052F
MRTVLLGGAPGVGKSSVARCLLTLAERGPELVQWVDVDHLWLHQPWRVDERMKTMVQANLRAVAAHAARAKVGILLITWVFQSAEMHRLVTALLPAGTTAVSIHLRAGYDTWHRRFEADPARPPVNEFFQARYEAAQATAADHAIDTDDLTPMEVAHHVAGVIGLVEPPRR